MVTQELIAEIDNNKADNRLHSILLILAMASILCTVGYLTLGFTGFLISVAFTAFSCVWGQSVSTAWIMRMYKASEIHAHQAPGLHMQFNQLARRANLEYLPKLYYIPSRMPNAFATGHDRSSAIAVTDGLIRLMNTREMNGILAHEMAHLMHRDTKVMSLADTMTRITATASRLGFFLILISGLFAILNNGFSVHHFVAFGVLFVSPTAMILLQLALSRSREFNADLGAVQLTGDPVGLASALTKLDRLTQRSGFWQRLLRPGPRRSQPAFLRTHPPTTERVKELLEYADQNRLEQYEKVQRHSQSHHDSQPRKIVVVHPRVRPRPRYRGTTGMWY